MASKKVEDAVKLVEDTYVSMEVAAKISGLSEVYFRRKVDEMEKETGQILKVIMFGKQVVEVNVAEQIKNSVASAKSVRTAKAEAKKLAKAEGKAKKDTGDTLLEVKYWAKQAGISIGRKNKAELIQLLADHNAKQEQLGVGDANEDETASE